MVVLAKGVDPLWAAQALLRRRKYDDCIEVCSTLLTANPYDQARREQISRDSIIPLFNFIFYICDADGPSWTPGARPQPAPPGSVISPGSPSQAAWYLKCRALTQKDYIDDLDVEEEAPPPAASPVLPAAESSVLRPAGAGARP